ncbi:MAG: hypothetical protein IT169_15020 [Bryobacterales bacterium]|nr:hypothetical protein [Bryobacterales bacterium]
MKPYRLSRELAIRARLPLFAALAGMLLLASCASQGPNPGADANAGAAVKILSFYPGQPAFAPGDQAQVCYGVENALSVRLEPPVAEIRPLTTKCVWFKPTGSMKLTLVASGADGKEARGTIDITVKAGAPPAATVPPEETSGASIPSGGSLIETFVATTTSIPPGGGATVCYVLREPATVTLQPPSGELGGDLKKCILLRPTTTTTYTLTAAAGAKTDSATVTIRVE